LPISDFIIKYAVPEIPLFGNTPEFWLNAQRAYDLWQAEKVCGQEIDKIKPLAQHKLRNSGEAPLLVITRT